MYDTTALAVTLVEGVLEEPGDSSATGSTGGSTGGSIGHSESFIWNTGDATLAEL
jgi:hypothetical protein